MTDERLPSTSTAAPGVTESAVQREAEREAQRRRHDLDALRGFAMLLGIVLHASLAFFPWQWPVQDASSSMDGPFDEIFHAIHGFRMPLFFLLSGFFTAMLWRRRGVGALVTHRLERVALPLALAFVTVVPLVVWSVGWAIDNGVDDYIEEHGDIWAAVFFGNEDAVGRLLDQGVDVSAPNPDDDGNTPLHIAAYTGNMAMAEYLLDRGADPAAAAVGGTPVDFAAYLGNEEVADVLVAAGGPDPRGDGSWQDLDWWAAGASEAIDEAEALGLESWLTSFYHLWFLWFLVWMVAGFAVVALLVDRFAPAFAGSGSWTVVALWMLVPLTIVPQLAMGDGGNTPVFGPDTSTGIVPTPHVFAYYATFFAFGALLYGRTSPTGAPLVERIGRWWPAFLVLCGVAFALGIGWTFDGTTPWWQASVAQVAFAWLAIVALIGLFHAALAKERRGVRYLSDSSYWMYLIHLPVIIIALSLVRRWDIPPGLKFILVVTGVTALLLVSYQLFVRYTPIGTLLNGKRTRPGHALAGSSSTVPAGHAERKGSRP